MPSNSPVAISDGCASRPPAPGSQDCERHWLTADQVAERLNIGKRTVYRMVQDGELPPPTKFGRVARWALGALVETERRWIDESLRAQQRQRNF
jgi:excisionase family DNA binding protein